MSPRRAIMLLRVRSSLRYLDVYPLQIILLKALRSVMLETSGYNWTCHSYLSHILAHHLWPRSLQVSNSFEKWISDRTGRVGQPRCRLYSGTARCPIVPWPNPSDHIHSTCCMRINVGLIMFILWTPMLTINNWHHTEYIKLWQRLHQIILQLS